MIIYSVFGIIFSLIICFFNRPQLIFKNKKSSDYNLISQYAFSPKTAYFPLIVFLFIVFIIFTVFREIDGGGIGGMDAIKYKLSFENATQSLIQSLFTQGFEPIYGLFVWIIRKISSDFRLFLFIYYTIVFFLQIKILSNVKITWLSIISYFAICYILIILSFCLMRNILALFLAWLAYIYLDEKKYKKSFLWITIAVLVHYSAIICYPVWIICLLSDKKYFSLKKVFVYWFVLFIFLFLLRSIIPYIILLINDKYVVYLNKYNMAINTFIGRSYIILLTMWKLNELIKRNPINRIMFVVLLVNLLIIPLQSIMPMMYRMLIFAEPAIFFIIPELIYIYSLKKNNYHINILIRLSLIFYLIWNIISFIRKSIASYGLDNYSNILF